MYLPPLYATMNVRNGEDFSRGVHEHRNGVWFRDPADRLGGHRPGVVLWTGKDVDHRRSRTDRQFQRLRRVDLDDPHTDRANRGVVHVARVRRDDDLVLLKTREVGNADVEIRIASGDTGGGRM